MTISYHHLKKLSVIPNQFLNFFIFDLIYTLSRNFSLVSKLQFYYVFVVVEIVSSSGIVYY